MTNKNLNDSLSHLHAELKKVKHVDKASSELLNKLGQDIQRILDNPGEVPEGHHKSLRANLDKSVAHFAVSHPALASLMIRVINMLSEMGI
ncbi:MAG TPA: DUF4404 family protein [Terriglobales bacterium]|nr:DUF4404 family protein [Terriglobales bacterium]